jgi:uncharacterized protein YecE (DUF72 family)
LTIRVSTCFLEGFAIPPIPPGFQPAERRGVQSRRRLRAESVFLDGLRVLFCEECSVEGIILRKYLIGTGGWQYFSVPGVQPLISYSRVFDFVEVNSTYYQIPPMSEVKKWREMVPPHFQFAVRAHRTAAHIRSSSLKPSALAAFDRTKQVCAALRAQILQIQAPASSALSKSWIGEFRSFISSADLDGLRLALEIRGVRSSKLPSELLKLMEDYNMIHCTDVSKGEMPAYESDVFYTRLFGKGEHNVYQPTDEELAEVDSKVTSINSQKIVMSFHFVRMYKDAARLKIYKQTGVFPKVTESTGLSSLQEVLEEDARFPSTKQSLMDDQGWKLFDLSERRRIHAKELLQCLPERIYLSVSEVIRSLESTVE